MINCFTLASLILVSHSFLVHSLSESALSSRVHQRNKVESNFRERLSHPASYPHSPYRQSLLPSKTLSLNSNYANDYANYADHRYGNNRIYEESGAFNVQPSIDANIYGGHNLLKSVSHHPADYPEDVIHEESEIQRKKLLTPERQRLAHRRDLSAIESKRFSHRREFGSNGAQNVATLQKAELVSANEERRMPIHMPMKRLYEHAEAKDKSTFGDIYFVAIVAGCSVAAIFGVISAGYCFYKFQQHNKAAADVEYPAYGVVGPATKDVSGTGNVSPIGDRKLAQSAQMYHYHHQKQQMIASEKAATSRNLSNSDVDSDEDNEEGEYTVYECPGLAPTGEMEVKNPLFQDDVTPVSTPPVNGTAKEK